MYDNNVISIPKTYKDTSTQHIYNLRNRKHVNYREDSIETDILFETNYLLQSLSKISINGFIVLDDNEKQQLQHHKYKKHLLAFSLPVQNNTHIQMRSNTYSDVSTPRYINYMVWDNKDSLIIEDARTFSNEIFKLYLSLFIKLNNRVKSLSFYMDYSKYIAMENKDYIKHVCCLFFCILYPESINV